MGRGDAHLAAEPLPVTTQPHASTTKPSVASITMMPAPLPSTGEPALPEDTSTVADMVKGSRKENCAAYSTRAHVLGVQSASQELRGI